MFRQFLSSRLAENDQESAMNPQRETEMKSEPRTYDLLSEAFDAARTAQAAPVKMWTRGVPVEAASMQQLLNTASLPFIHKWLAVMPDVHYGKGSTIGSVIPTVGAIIPAAVGVD